MLLLRTLIIKGIDVDEVNGIFRFSTNMGIYMYTEDSEMTQVLYQISWTLQSLH